MVVRRLRQRVQTNDNVRLTYLEDTYDKITEIINLLNTLKHSNKEKIKTVLTLHSFNYDDIFPDFKHVSSLKYLRNMINQPYLAFHIKEMNKIKEIVAYLEHERINLNERISFEQDRIYEDVISNIPLFPRKQIVVPYPPKEPKIKTMYDDARIRRFN
jgi:hypothetical protein